MSDCKANAEKAMDLFKEKYQDKYPEAVNCLIKDRDTLLTFYRFPAIHWSHIRTTNPIESTFSTLRHRTRNTNGAFSLDSALSMMFQLAIGAQKTYKKISRLEGLADIVNGVVFEDGIPVEAEAI